MPGVKGSGGPPPKRSDQRRRSNKTAGEERVANATQGASIHATAPAPSDDWHDIAKLWFASLAESGQAAFYQASDWGQAYVLAEAISRELKPQALVVGAGKDAQVVMLEQPMKGATLSAFLKGCTDLLVSETARRRAALELQRQAPVSEKPAAAVTNLATWKKGVTA